MDGEGSVNMDHPVAVLLGWIFYLSPKVGLILCLLGAVQFILGHRRRGIRFGVVGVVLYFLPYVFAGS